MGRDVVHEVLADHTIIRDLWKRYQNAVDGFEEEALANTLARELAIHNTTEEIILYPAIEKNLEDGKATIEENREEHRQVKADLNKIDALQRNDPTFKELLEKAATEFDLHAQKEETDVLIRFKEATSEEERHKLGEEFVAQRSMVPTRAHPSAPDKPPMATAVGAAVMPVDKTKDKGRMFAEILDRNSL